MSATPLIWITSTPPSGEELAQELSTRGHDVLYAPLLEVSAMAGQDAQPPENAALAFTSANGVRAFCALSDRRDWTVYCVGESTARAAEQAGFTDICVADSDVVDLARVIIHAAPDELVHYSGVHTAGDLTGTLSKAGIKARREIIYGTQPVPLLPRGAHQALSSPRPLIIALLSPRGAQTLARHWPDEVKAPVTLVSLSSAINAAIPDLIQAKRLIAERPDRESLIAALVKAAADA